MPTREAVPHWCDSEFAHLDLGDSRLNSRLVQTAINLSAQPSASINRACQDWADSKAAYRLFDNEQVTADKILSPHQERTQQRMREHALVLAIQDQTFVNYTDRPQTTGLGPIRSPASQLFGLIMHTTLCVTPQGVPLGVLAQQVWARSEEKKGLIKSELRNQPIEEKESYQWVQALEQTITLAPDGTQVVTVGDRGADVYELFVRAHALQTGVLVRVAQDRVLQDEKAKKLRAHVQAAPIAGYIKVHVPEKENEPERVAVVAVRFRSTTLKPPWRPQSPDKAPLPALDMDIVLAQEVDPPADVTPLEWLLLTNVPVHDFEDAVERIQWYRCRWHIEVFFKVLKSGCCIEACRLRTASRLIRFLALCSIIAWRLFWITQLNRHCPDMPCTAMLTEHEWQALYAKIYRLTALPTQVPTVRQAVRWIAQLGGFLARKRDGEPGVTVIWRGWQRLQDIASTWLLARSPAEQPTCG